MGTRRPVFVFVIVAIALLVVAGCNDSESRTGKSKGDGAGASRSEVQKFLDQLDEAVREGNTDFRAARLHPAVIERSGEQ